MNSDEAKCELCGEPMPEGEEMFNYHGYSGPCPKSPLKPVGAPPAGTPPLSAEQFHLSWCNEHGIPPEHTVFSSVDMGIFAEAYHAYCQPPSAPAPAPQADLLEEARIKLGQLCVPDSKKGAYHRVTTKDTSWFVDWENRLQAHAPSAPAGQVKSEK